MISNQQYSTEPVKLTMPHHFANGGLISQPFESELRNRLHDILEQWEELAKDHEGTEMEDIIYVMSDQISDAMYPQEDADD